MMITRQEVITSLHEPEKFILAVVEVSGGFASRPRNVRGALDEREPPFDQDAIQVQPEAPVGSREHRDDGRQANIMRTDIRAPFDGEHC